MDVIIVDETDNAPHKMRYALTAIAQEVKRFYSFPASSDLNENEHHGKINKELSTCKSRLRLEKMQIGKLKKNLKTACDIAKTVISAKENETLAVNSQINLIRQESANLIKKNVESSDIIQKLTIEKQGLSDKLENIHNFIELGYQQLQKMRSESLDDLTIVMKLKHIMICCGQYYADYHHEHEKCLQLEQKNRFLTNKLNILANNLETATEELNNFQHKKAKSNKKSNSETENIQRIGCMNYDKQFGQDKTVAKMTSENSTRKRESCKSTTNHKTQKLDLSSHLLLVKNLLNDQDFMLQEIKKLSHELDICEAS